MLLHFSSLLGFVIIIVVEVDNLELFVSLPFMMSHIELWWLLACAWRDACDGLLLHQATESCVMKGCLQTVLLDIIAVEMINIKTKKKEDE